MPNAGKGTHKTLACSPRSKDEISHYVVSEIRRHLAKRDSDGKLVTLADWYWAHLHKTNNDKYDDFANFLSGRTFDLAYLIRIANALKVPLFRLLPGRRLDPKHDLVPRTKHNPIHRCKVLLDGIDTFRSSSKNTNCDALAIAKNIKRYMDKDGYSVADIADAVDYPDHYVIRFFCTGQGSYVLLVQIADAINVDVIDLLPSSLLATDVQIIKAYRCLQSIVNRIRVD